MARTTPATHERILRSAYALFYRRGYGRVSMDAIAEASGVTKRTIYQHFRSKDDLLAELLDRHVDDAMRVVNHWLSGEAHSPRMFIEGVFRGIETWATTPRWLGTGYTRIAMELADLPGHPARRMAQRHKRTVETMVASRLSELGCPDSAARAREVVLLMEGCICLALIHADCTYIKAAAGAARRLFQEPHLGAA